MGSEAGISQRDIEQARRSSSGAERVTADEGAGQASGGGLCVLGDEDRSFFEVFFGGACVCDT